MQHSSSVATALTSKPQTLESIQALRGIAAMAVVFFHARSSLNSEGFALGNMLFRQGEVGVDVFFVISGFIIAYVTRDDMKVLPFMLNRAIRIVPLYYLATAVMIWVKDIPINRHVLKSLLFIPRANEHAPDYWYATLIVGWTLNYEMFFYAVFAAAMMFRRARLPMAVFLITLLVTAPQFFYSGAITLDAYSSPIMPISYVSMATNPMLLEFAAGILLAIAFKGQWSMPRHIAGALALSLLALCLWAIQFGGAYGHGITRAGLPAIGVVASFLLWEKCIGFRRIAPMQILGDASYSLYLVHVPILIALDNNIGNLGVTTFSLKITLTLIAGIVVHFWVEKPLTLFLKRLFSFHWLRWAATTSSPR